MFTKWSHSLSTVHSVHLVHFVYLVFVRNCLPSISNMTLFILPNRVRCFVNNILR